MADQSRYLVDAIRQMQALPQVTAPQPDLAAMARAVQRAKGQPGPQTPSPQIDPRAAPWAYPQ